MIVKARSAKRRRGYADNCGLKIVELPVDLCFRLTSSPVGVTFDRVLLVFAFVN